MHHSLEWNNNGKGSTSMLTYNVPRRKGKRLCPIVVGLDPERRMRVALDENKKKVKNGSNSERIFPMGNSRREVR